MTEKHWVLTGQPCPMCPSSDAYAVDSEGWGYCFSCDKSRKEGDHMEISDEVTTTNGDFKFIDHRGITKESFEFYETWAKIVDGTPVEIGFRYPNGGVKVRNLLEKRFHTHGDMKGATLFGKNRFDKGSHKSITITEGELDAITIHQVIGSFTAAVSVPSSSSAYKACKEEWSYINSFDKIILCFDNDVPGNEAARKVATLFDFNKIYRVVLDKYKDPNDYLQHDEPKELAMAWHGAKKYTPDNIISSFKDVAASLSRSKADMLATYPHEGLQNALYGLHKGEYITFKGDEGIGKTEMFRWMEHHILKTIPDSKIGIIHLEDDEGDVVRGIATYEEKYPYIHPESVASDEDVMKAYRKAVSENEDRVFIYDKYDVEDEGVLLDTIRFLVSVCGCQFIFLDHITWLAIGSDQESERIKLDRIARDLKNMAKELRCCIIQISHTNDEGKTRGSRYIAKASHTVIHMTRDIGSSSPHIKRQLNFLVEKARKGGNTGRVPHAMFDNETMTLIDPKPERELILPGVKKNEANV